jgi:DNA-binding NarL/FixJ family response regulator
VTIRVLLADDHTLLREGLRVLLSSAEGIEVVADVADGQEAIAAVQRLEPDVAILDIAMPKLDGLTATGMLTDLHLKTRVIILSMHLSPEYIEQAFLCGAVGYLAKDTAADDLETAIRTVASGGTYVSVNSRPTLVPVVRSNGAPAETRVERLTHRQNQVLCKIAEGRTTKGIARDLEISAKTVETHRAQLMERLGIYDVAGLVRFAVRNGLVDASA